ncbi:MAG: hypothetical protein IKJ74_05180 [Clostridia bacterium]|nr:hypothetical protein [Clostridia bacterium]
MKKTIAFLLILALLFSLASCSEAEGQTVTLTETVTAETEEKKTKEIIEWKPTVERVHEKVETPLSPERIAQIPIANSSMSTDELRQICVDYVCLSTTFQWTPSTDYRYLVERQGASATFLEGQLYGGIPYVNTASGNLYRVLEYYDKETGVMDMFPFRSNNLICGTACSGTAGWGWSRVINSAVCKWTAELNVNHGLLRVGNYTYDDGITRYGEGIKNDCSDIAQQNGSAVLYESYALTDVGDCLVNNGHVRMVKEKPVVVRKEDGSIDAKKSYIIQCEQGLYTTSDTHDRFTSDGTKYKIQGNDNYKATFERLFKDGYLPHTFKEFLGTDPVEKATCTIEHGEPTANLNQLHKCTVKANYTISHIITIVRDTEGNQLTRYIKYLNNHFSREISLLECLPGNAVLNHAKEGTNTIEIQAYLGNGELLTVYTGTLSE